MKFSMKDICDKIRDAVSIEKDLQREIEQARTRLRGKNSGGLDWELSVFLDLFVEAVLNWARDMQTRQPDTAIGQPTQSVFSPGPGVHLQPTMR